MDDINMITRKDEYALLALTQFVVGGLLAFVGLTMAFDIWVAVAAVGIFTFDRGVRKITNSGAYFG